MIGKGDNSFKQNDNHTNHPKTNAEPPLSLPLLAHTQNCLKQPDAGLQTIPSHPSHIKHSHSTWKQHQIYKITSKAPAKRSKFFAASQFTDRTRKNVRNSRTQASKRSFHILRY
ncbi:hypothetical protein L596_015213 [Steinernema carpocapsae]|uniref:Uncharacterized protein n=1 Tax=Steinernema carpocapsae TaxID=34508 RepID=A0A4U5NF94_STECR|nr:hypothetical protein L596_015213 [Steinernema carpocapsae]